MQAFFLSFRPMALEQSSGRAANPKRIYDFAVHVLELADNAKRSALLDRAHSTAAE